MGYDFKSLTRQIPGYDPWATAGDCVFDADAASIVLDFFPECLRHVKGELAGTPFVLEPWQSAVVANLFGWKRPDGTRRYRRGMLYVPRKNGKTTLAAGILLYVLFCDGEPGAEIYSAAADRDQARLVFDQAAGMVRQDNDLYDRCTVYSAHGGSKAIVLSDMSGSYRTISAEAGTKHGFNTHMAIVDELHAQPNRELVDVIETSTGSRRQPLVLFTTTADYAHPSICNEMHDYACKVRDGVIEDASFLPAIWGAGIEDDWLSPETWAKANPNLGVSLSREFLAQECQRAQESPAYENTFKRLHLNIVTEQAKRWIPLEVWDSCAGAVEADALRGKPCYAGLDLSTTQDMSACVLYFPASRALLPFFWLPDDSAHAREKRDKVPYLTWARQGLIELTPGNVIDYGYVETRLAQLKAQYDIKELAYDPWNATQTALNLQANGFKCVEFRQGFQSMNEPSKEFLRLLTSGVLRHGGHPVLRWMASNVAVKSDPAGNIKPDKEHSFEKIDGIVAAIMALGRSMVTDRKAGSVYETRGVLRV